MNKINEFWKQINILYTTQEVNQYLKVIKSLEQLRLYVELAEEIIIHSGEITNWESYLERGKNISLLINKIKEQGNEQD